MILRDVSRIAAFKYGGGVAVHSALLGHLSRCFQLISSAEELSRAAAAA